MIILMKTTAAGVHGQFHAGKEYVVLPETGQAFIDAGAAVLVSAEEDDLTIVGSEQASLAVEETAVRPARRPRRRGRAKKAAE